MMKKEKEDLERKQKKFYSKDGDYITILNVLSNVLIPIYY
jgi:hypothetical protein